jgi:hypothetical protein
MVKKIITALTDINGLIYSNLKSIDMANIVIKIKNLIIGNVNILDKFYKDYLFELMNS